MTIRVFVGCAPNHEDAESQAVLEWSLRKHSSEPVEVIWMKLSKDPDSFWSGWDTANWVTPFSGFRWAIPAYCNFEGRAIYCDSDVIFMADPAELWNQPMSPGAIALAKGGGSWRYCVSLWDCAEAGKHFPDVETMRADSGSHQRMVSFMKERSFLTHPFQGDWNCLDGDGHTDLKDGLLKALHYTGINTQPQLRYALPRLAAAGQKHWFDGTVQPHARPDVEALFDEILIEAAANGFGVQRYLQDEPYGPFKKQSLVGYKGRPRT